MKANKETLGRQATTWLLVLCLLLAAFGLLNARAEATAAPAAGSQSAAPAQVIEGKVAGDQQISLVFEGIGDQQTMDALREALKQRGVTAAFFLPAIPVAEAPEIAQSLANDGHAIGNYMLNGEKHVEELSYDRQQRGVSRSQEVLTDAVGTPPVLYRGNLTQYSDELLGLLGEYGIRYALTPSIYLNHTSFASREQAMTFAAKTPWGSLISVKIDQALAPEEMPPAEKPTDKPAPQVTSGPKEGAERSSPAPWQDRLVDVVGWVMDAYQAQGFTFVAPQDLLVSQGSEFALLLTRALAETQSTQVAQGITADSPQAQVLTSNLIAEKEIVLLVEGFASKALIEKVREVFRRHNAQAAFFLPATTAAAQPQMLRGLLQDGHILGNYMLEGERHADQLTRQEQVTSLYRAQLLLEESSGTKPVLFKANLSAYTPELLQAAQANGLTLALKPTVFINHTSFTTQQQAAGFARRTEPGTVLSIKMGQAIEAEELPVVVKREPTPEPAAPTASPEPKASLATSTPTVPAEEARTAWEDRLIQNLDWLLGGLKAEGFAFITADTMVERQATDYATHMRAALTETESAQIAASLNASSQKARIIPGGTAPREGIISLMFEGTPTFALLDNLLPALKEKNVQATFFVPAEAVAREPQLATRILQEGHQLGNYLMLGEKQIQQASADTIAAGMYRAQMLIEGFSAARPTLFKANFRGYTDAMLQIARATGIDYVLEPTLYLNHLSFTSAEQAKGYVGRLHPGDLISLKINQPLEKEELDKGATPQPSTVPTTAPATQAPPPAAPSGESQTTPVADQDWQSRLLLVTRWLIDAAWQDGYTFVTPQQLLDQGPGTGGGGGGQPEAASPPPAFPASPAQLLREIPVLGNAVGLLFEGSPDAATTASILKLLADHGAQATFFLPGAYVEKNPEIAAMILNAGQTLGNTLMEGEQKAETLDPAQVLQSMQRAQNALLKAGTKPMIFKGSVSQPTPELLQTAGQAGIPYGAQPGYYLNHTSFRTAEQAVGYVKKTPAGSILSIKIGLPIDASELPAPAPAPKPPAATPGPATATPSALPTEIVTQAPLPTPSVEDRLLNVVRWVLDAYAENGMRVISLEQLIDSQQSPYSTMMQQLYSPESTAEYRRALNSSGGQAELYESRPGLARQISLVFENYGSPQTMGTLLDLLKKYQVKATFFVPADQLAVTPELAQRIMAEGHTLGNYGLFGERALDTKPVDDIMASIWRAQQLLTKLSGTAPSLYKGNVVDYGPELLQAVKAAGIAAAVKPSAFVNHGSFVTAQQADAFARNTDWGTILSVKINQVVDPKDLPPKPPQDESAEPTPTAQPEPRVTPAPATITMSPEDRLVLVVDWLLNAYTQRHFNFVTPEDIQSGWVRELSLMQQRTMNPSGQQAELMTNARTTEKKVSLLFSNIPDSQTLEALRNTLKELNVTANISVTADEVLNYKPQLLALTEDGHAIYSRGFRGDSITRSTYRDVFLEIRRNQMLMEQELGIMPVIYTPLMGQSGEQVLEAAFDTKVTPATYNLRARVNTGDTIDEVMRPFQWGIKRGDIIHMQLDSYPLIDEALRRVVKMVHDTTYSFVTIEDLQLRQYQQIPLEQIPGWDAIKVNPDYNPDADVKGKRLARIPVKTKVMFLTFDDWGTDQSTTRILDVLDELDVKATFFVVASRAESNPNLLRAISEAGHSIASHSYEHILITDMTPQELQEDSVKAFQALTRIIGKPSDLIFRPPQLEQNKAAVNAIIAAGYKAVIQSNVSTHDYTRTAAQVVNYVRIRMGGGQTIVLHVTPQSSAAEALPGIVEMARKAGFTFGRIIDYLPDEQ